jgi:hypothetical protein
MTDADFALTRRGSLLALLRDRLHERDRAAAPR